VNLATSGDDGDGESLHDARWRARFLALALGLLCITLLVGKTAWQGSAALADGDAAARRKDPDAAIRSWTEAARAYLPGAAYVGMAHRRLVEAGDAAAKRGDRARAERAYAAVCEAIADTQWAITPFPEELARAEAGLRAVLGAKAPPSITPQLTQAMRARTWAAVAFGGLLGVALALALLRRAGNGRGRDVVRRTWLAVAVLAGGVLLFALGVHQV
jgi:hypothetical protein